MTHKVLHITVCILNGFVALTAIGGGIAMLTGVDQFPLAWLEGTPFKNYTVPALLLTIMVGGSSLMAAVNVLKKSSRKTIAGMIAGIILAGYISVEVAILKQAPPGPTVIEYLYFGIGLVLFGINAFLWKQEHRRQFHVS